MSASALAPIVAEIMIDAPIARVWEVLTAEATLPRWLGAMNYRREVGTTFHMQRDGTSRLAGSHAVAVHCDITALQPPHRFCFTWYLPGTPKTLVQISLLSESDERTFVRLVHEGWEQLPAETAKSIHDRLGGGWRNAVLPDLKMAAEAR